MKHLIGTTLVALLAFITATANAQQLSETDKAEAMKHFEQGQAQVREKKFDAAYRSFLSGYQLSGKPLFLFNMAECSRELGKSDRAIRDYEMYLTQDPDGKLAATARQRLKELKANGNLAQAVVDESDKPKPKKQSSQTKTDKVEPVAQTAKLESHPDDASPSAVDRSISPHEESQEEESGSFFTSAPFWIGVGVVVVAGSVTAIALASSGSDPSCEGACVDLRSSF